MPANKITIKHNKHCIHPCPNDKKIELLKLLISQNENSKIIIVSVEENESLKELSSLHVEVMSDKELYKAKETTCDLLISYDLPTKAIVYISRLGSATKAAIILLDSTEQKQLYPIETLLGRVIRIEKIEGFEHGDLKLTIAQAKPESEYNFKVEQEKQEEREAKKKRDEERGYSDKPKKFDKKDDKFDKSKSKFKDKKPKKVGRKINITARKAKED